MISIRVKDEDSDLDTVTKLEAGFAPEVGRHSDPVCHTFNQTANFPRLIKLARLL